MAKITEEQVAFAYMTSKDVFLGILKKADGIAILSCTYGLNKTSAGDFINCFKYMLEGRLFQRAMSHSAMDYFLCNIAKDFPSSYLKNALDALIKHIEYWEAHYKTNAISMRKVESHYRKVFQAEETAELVQSKFENDVFKSLKLTRSERLKKIEEAPTKPRRIVVTTSIYQRNPYVVAERLTIADGSCEKCGQIAPFIRLKDSTPYLEVHHIKRLCDGGLDILENTTALCPNCHREMHFG
ncbi:HNH endonuclease [Photobacterium swingsii]|nr:HNH endonuclease signature motif containing protein [Photobacterium swingsii]